MSYNKIKNGLHISTQHFTCSIFVMEIVFSAHKKLVNEQAVTCSHSLSTSSSPTLLSEIGQFVHHTNPTDKGKSSTMHVQIRLLLILVNLSPLGFLSVIDVFIDIFPNEICWNQEVKKHHSWTTNLVCSVLHR